MPLPPRWRRPTGCSAGPVRPTSTVRARSDARAHARPPRPGRCTGCSSWSRCSGPSTARTTASRCRSRRPACPGWRPASRTSRARRRVIVGYAGFFGRRIAEMAARLRRRGRRGRRATGARRCRTRRCSRRSTAIRDARLLAVVHAETSTGAQHPLRSSARRCAAATRCCSPTASRRSAASRSTFDDWGVDFAYSCTQKCLGAPPGMSPVALSRARAGSGSASARPPCRSRSTSSCCSTTGSSGRSPTTTRRRSCTSTRSTRRCAAHARGGPRGALGAPRGGRAPPPAQAARPRARAARRPGPPARRT